jgi:hypothetical protein
MPSCQVPQERRSYDFLRSLSPQATVNLATETALVHVLVPKGSKGQNGVLSELLIGVAEKLSQVRSAGCTSSPRADSTLHIHTYTQKKHVCRL